MEERQKEELIARMQLSGDVRDFLKGPGYAVIDKFVSDKVKNGYKEWLKTTDPAMRETLWHKAQAFAEFESFLKRVMIEGELAADHLHRLANKDEEI